MKKFWQEPSSRDCCPLNQAQLALWPGFIEKVVDAYKSGRALSPLERADFPTAASSMILECGHTSLLSPQMITQDIWFASVPYQKWVRGVMVPLQQKRDGKSWTRVSLLHVEEGISIPLHQPYFTDSFIPTAKGR